ncbi:MAG: DUF1553 domain-containing protein [Pirellulaceae bacterium]
MMRGEPIAKAATPSSPFYLHRGWQRCETFPLGGSGRLELPQAIAGDDNPLTARVIVNRVWSKYFDRGLVESPDDFGLRSSPPSHPLLLDWLASQFMRQGWSLKMAGIARFCHRRFIAPRAVLHRTMRCSAIPAIVG